MKARLYTRANIPEAWLVNLIGRWVEVYRGPSPADYTTLLKVPPGKSIVPQAFADVTIVVDELPSE